MTQTRQRYYIWLVACAVGVLLFIKLYPTELCITVTYPPPLYLRHVDKEPGTSPSIAEEQRDTLSRQLHTLKQAMGQLECEVRGGSTSNSGGWCRRTSLENSGQHITDMPLVKALSSFFKGKRVVSFGDGPGAYKRELVKLGEVQQYDAYDGAPFGDETSEGRVQFLDLTLPVFGLPIYDWVLSLEVAEHIPAMYEYVYLDNIRRHCTEGVILSWAMPEQGGLSHVNLQTFEYVVNTMDKLGFVHDNKTSAMLQHAASLEWLQNNINVFRKKAKLKNVGN